MGKTFVGGFGFSLLLVLTSCDGEMPKASVTTPDIQHGKGALTLDLPIRNVRVAKVPTPHELETQGPPSSARNRQGPPAGIVETPSSEVTTSGEQQ